MKNFGLGDAMDLGEFLNGGEPLVDVVLFVSVESSLLFSSTQEVLVVLGGRVVVGDHRDDIVILSDARRVTRPVKDAGDRGGRGRGTND